MNTRSVPLVTPWLHRYPLCIPPRLRLFCLPYAGGAASLYRSWRAALPADVELCAVQLPGREGRLAEPALDDPEALLAQLQAAVLPWLDRPFVLLGYSMGGLIAHALACRLQASGGPTPERLVVAACSSPDHPAQVDPDRMSVAGFTACLRALGGTPEAVFEHAELLEMLLPMLQADFRLVRRLREAAMRRPGDQPLRCPITALAAADDGHATPLQVARWADFTQGGLDAVTIPGGHFAVWNQPRLLMQAALGGPFARPEPTVTG
ncbi:alpha/beta fold hydrolase [uncultured Sphaerotilus sp.]|uniref:thioesterase II family protein n=1 Tax=uncultured Sphaerotilus sp. TaxID=474984 RepID=UPI0030CA3371